MATILPSQYWSAVSPIEKTVLPFPEAAETSSASYEEYFTALNDTRMPPCETYPPGSHFTIPFPEEYIPLLTYLMDLDALPPPTTKIKRKS